MGNGGHCAELERRTALCEIAGLAWPPCECRNLDGVACFRFGHTCQCSFEERSSQVAFAGIGQCQHNGLACKFWKSRKPRRYSGCGTATYTR